MIVTIVENEAWEALQRKLVMVRDDIRAVVQRRTTGFYLYGAPGTGKGHQVRETLLQAGLREGIDFVWVKGAITAKALFQLLQRNFDRIIILDDVSQIFKDKNAMQILLAALEANQPGKEYRTVVWATNNNPERFPFMGGVICLSNLKISNDPVSQALASRVDATEYNLTDEEIELTIRHAASQGVGGLTARESLEVADYLLAAMRKKGISPDLRQYFDKAIPKFKQWRDQDGGAHWHDRLNQMLQEQLVSPQRRVIVGTTANENKRIAIEIIRTIKGNTPQWMEFQKRTNAAIATWYRAKREAIAELSLSIDDEGPDGDSDSD